MKVQLLVPARMSQALPWALALTLPWLVALTACTVRPGTNDLPMSAKMAASSGAASAAPPTRKEIASMTAPRAYKKPDDQTLRKQLSPLQYRVTQQDATEPPFSGAYWDEHRPGLYVDVATGEPLFSSTDKFDSGTGWPSFVRPLAEGAVASKTDRSLGVTRVEVRSAVGDSHLGHVFDDGPKPTGMRYCINSASLRFVPLAELQDQGYGAYLPLFGQEAPAATAEELAAAKDNSCATPKAGEAPGCEATLEVAYLAGGCFWGMEDLLRAIPGVVETDVGYMGGTTPAPRYESVKTGQTGHAESVKVVFDPKLLKYEDLLENWFFRMHDPTTLNRQGNDAGSQYRSAIFYSTAAQKGVAEAVKARVDQSGKWKKPVVTEITAAATFTAAEGYHQDYLAKNPGGYTCHYMRP